MSQFNPVILAHTAAAFAALALGAAIFLRRKGSTTHRLLGRGWVALMLVTAVSSFWIQSTGGFSWIHGLSVIAVAALAGAVVYAVRGNIRRHRIVIKALYGSLVVAGLFTLLPHRQFGRMLWSALAVV